MENVRANDPPLQICVNINQAVDRMAVCGTKPTLNSVHISHVRSLESICRANAKLKEP